MDAFLADDAGRDLPSAWVKVDLERAGSTSSTTLTVTFPSTAAYTLFITAADGRSGPAKRQYMAAAAVLICTSSGAVTMPPRTTPVLSELKIGLGDAQQNGDLIADGSNSVRLGLSVPLSVSLRAILYSAGQGDEPEAEMERNWVATYRSTTAAQEVGPFMVEAVVPTRGDYLLRLFAGTTDQPSLRMAVEYRVHCLSDVVREVPPMRYPAFFDLGLRLPPMVQSSLRAGERDNAVTVKLMAPGDVNILYVIVCVPVLFWHGRSHYVIERSCGARAVAQPLTEPGCTRVAANAAVWK